MKEKERELENNIYFWQKLDTLILSSRIEIDHPQGSANENYPRMIYPVDAGYLKGTGQPVLCYRGSLRSQQATAVIVQSDILARDCLAKVLIGCTEAECSTILKFINSQEFQKAILIWRGHETPSWAYGEQ